MWFWLIVIAVVVGAIWGAISSDKGEEKAGAFSGAVAGGMGCGYILFQILIWGLGIMIMLWLFGAIFG